MSLFFTSVLVRPVKQRFAFHSIRNLHTKSLLHVYCLDGNFRPLYLSKCLTNSQFRWLHVSSPVNESKVEETLEALKLNLKEEQEKLAVEAASALLESKETPVDKIDDLKKRFTQLKKKHQKPAFDFQEPPVDKKLSFELTPFKKSNLSYDPDVKVNLVVPKPSTDVTKVNPKTTIVSKILKVIKHYYHGFRLLFIDVRVSLRLIWSVLNGKSLTRREKKQLVRTTADLFRLLPFLVFIIVPFAEFLLPVVLKFFPGMLPSTFKEADVELEKARKKLKLNLEMAKFLQNTIEETALQRKDATGENATEFVRFMEEIRKTGAQTSNEDILKFSKLFEDNITLDNLSRSQLHAMCQLLEITPVGPSYILRFQIEIRLRDLKADDKLIQKEGVDSMAIWELQEACRMRGMRAFGVPEVRLKRQLNQWLELHLNKKIPTSLLLLSRTLYYTDQVSTEEKIKATILSLPDTLAEETKVKLSEVTGDKVDNKSKLQVIKQEEELIKKEKEELIKVKEEKELKQKEEEQASKQKTFELLKDLKTPFVIDSTTPEKKSKLSSLDKIIAKEEIYSNDLEKLEDVLEKVIDSKLKFKSELEDIEELKKEFLDYKDNLDQLKGMIDSTPSDLEKPQGEWKESKSAKRLSKKVQTMISKLDQSVSKLTQEISPKQNSAPYMTPSYSEHTMAEEVPDFTAKEMLREQSTMVAVHELMSAFENVEMMEKDGESKSEKYQTLARILDSDHDGLIEYKEARKLLELLGDTNLKLDPEQIVTIVQLLKKERLLKEEKKKLESEKSQMKQKPLEYKQPLIPEMSKLNNKSKNSQTVIDAASQKSEK